MKFKTFPGPMATFSFRSERENATGLIRRVISDTIEKSSSLTWDERNSYRRFLGFLAKVQVKHPDATISMADRTPTRVTLVVWHPVGCPSGSSPTLKMPATGAFVKALQALSLAPRMGGYVRTQANDDRKVVVIPKQKVELIKP